MHRRQVTEKGLTANGVALVQPMSRVSDLPIVNGHYWLRHSFRPVPGTGGNGGAGLGGFGVSFLGPPLELASSNFAHQASYHMGVMFEGRPERLKLKLRPLFLIETKAKKRLLDIQKHACRRWA
jgi:hypothetical protein